MTPDEFRRHGHEMIEWIARYYADMENRPVQAQSAPGELKALLPPSAPFEPENFDRILADMDTLILPHLTLWQHPRFFGYFPSNSLGAGVLGDLMSTALGVLGISWQSSPAVTEVEEIVVDWFRQMVDLSSNWFGVINDTASTSTLVAFLCAREKATDYSMARGGMQAEERHLVIYTSASAHSSVMKAALLAGFGRDYVRLIETDGEFAMRPEALQDAIAGDVAQGRLPCAVVATVGGTATTSIDPVREIAAIAGRQKLWLHVDAAMAGNAMILPECRWMWAGIEAADSLAINAHKWLGVPFDCSLYFTRDEAHLIRVMSTNPAYLQSEADGKVRNLRDAGIPLGRRFRALKMWFLIREQGVSGLQARLRRDLDLAQQLAAKITKQDHWHIIAPVVLQTVCVRFEPPALPRQMIDQFTRDWASAINASGEAYVTPATADGRWMVRISIGSASTRASDVEAIWDLMQAKVKQTLLSYPS